MQLFSITVLMLTLVGPMHAQFTRGNLVLLQAGDGVRPFGALGNPILLREFSPGVLSFGFEVALPTNGSNAFVIGNSAFTGSISLSPDEHSLTVAGYNTPLPYTNTSSLDSSAGVIVPRAVATVNHAGAFSLRAITTNAFGGGTIRGGASDGKGNFWAGGAASGIRYLGTNSTSTLVGTAGAGAIRNISTVNRALYYSSSQFPVAGFSGVVMFTNGFPTNASAGSERLIINTTTNAIPGATTAASPKGFAINRLLTIAYVVDMRSTAQGGGIYRFNGDGIFGSTNWTYAYTIPSTVGAIQDITVDFSGTTPKIYGIVGTAVGNALFSLLETGAGSTFNVLTTAPANTVFRGIALAPVEPVRMSIQLIAGQVRVNWNGGILQATSPIDGSWFDQEGVESPYLFPSTANPQEFFRVQQNLYP